MSSDKRLLLCMILSALCFLGIQTFLVQTGLVPAPAARKPVVDPVLAQDDGAIDGLPRMPDDPFLPDEALPVEPNVAAAIGPDPDLVSADQLVLGASDVADSKSPYLLRLQLTQDDASVFRATSSRHDAEFDRAAMNQKPGRLVLIQDNPKAPHAPGSMAVFITPVTKRAGADADDDAEAVATRSKAGEAITRWEVVRDQPDTPIVRPVTRTNPTTKAVVQGQELAFRAKLVEPAVEVTKVFRIWEGEEGFEVDLKFAGPSQDSKLSYRLVGPHGIPIEGEWYTSTYRDIFFGVRANNATEVITRTAYDAHKNRLDPAQRVSTNPLEFAGVEDQYFATLVQPNPIPRTQEDRWDVGAEMFLVKFNPEDTQKADLTVAIDSKPISVGPNLGEVVHSYKVFAGPKTKASLTPYHAEELASYRKNQWITIPFAGTLAKNIIAPLLSRIYALTESVSHAFGGTKGNYGIAIILLTMTVRLIMFPLGRKQAMMAKKMQDLQPVLAEVKERFKDDKEGAARETMAVYKRNKVNPAAGCLPALIQMPIFVGLWQCLNNSVELRHSSFLYIRDLAAPDMAFRFPVDLPVVGHYLNILPFLVVALMLVQTKLFTPPPTTPEAEAQQKMMKYMMVFMAFMFYKVPSGLGLYFITSSLWQVCERLLLPKLVKAPKVTVEDEFGRPDDGRDRPGPRGGPKPGPGAGGNGNGHGKGPQGWLGKRLEKLLEEAAKDKTIRNINGNGNGNGNGQSNGSGGRPRSKPPGKRR